MAIRIFIQVNTSAQNVANVVRAVVYWQYTGEIIQDRNHLNVLFVANDSHKQVTLLSTAEFTVEKNRTNVTCVTRHLVILEIYTITRESTRERNRTSVHCVTKVSVSHATCRHISVVYTATEERINVIIVE